MDIERYSTTYEEIRRGSPCAAGLKTFYGYMGGMRAAQSAKRISLVRILHHNPEHFGWMRTRKSLTIRESNLIQNAYRDALVHCGQHLVVNDQLGQSFSYGVRAIGFQAQVDEVVKYAENLLDARVELGLVVVTMGMNPK